MRERLPLARAAAAVLGFVLMGMCAVAPAVAQQDLDPLLRILVRKGILTVQEARDVQREADRERAMEQREIAEEVRRDMPEGTSDIGMSYEFGKGVTFEKGEMDLNVGGRVQVRYDAAQEDTDILGLATSREGDNETFDIRRARVNFEGHLTDELGYQFQFDVADDAEVRQAWVNYQPMDQFGIRGGQYKVPFGREELTSSGNLQFVDRSIVNHFFHPGYDIGLELHGKSLEEGKFHYAVGAFNGEGSGEDNRDARFLYAARVGFDPFGYFKPSGSDIKRSDDPKLAFAAQYLKASHEGADQDTWGLDFGYQQHGWSVEGGYYDTEWDSDAGPTGDFDADGWRLQAGYMVYQDMLEIAARYAEVDADFPNGFVEGAPGPWEELVAGGVVWDQVDALTLAFNIFFHGHASKLQFDYTWLDESSTLSDEEGDLDNDVFRAQYQVKF